LGILPLDKAGCLISPILAVFRKIFGLFKPLSFPKSDLLDSLKGGWGGVERGWKNWLK